MELRFDIQAWHCEDLMANIFIIPGSIKASECFISSEKTSYHLSEKHFDHKRWWSLTLATISGLSHEDWLPSPTALSSKVERYERDSWVLKAIFVGYISLAQSIAYKRKNYITSTWATI